MFDLDKTHFFNEFLLSSKFYFLADHKRNVLKLTT